MKELEVRQATTARVSDVRSVLADLRPLAPPVLTLRWRGRAGVRALDSRFSAVSEAVPGGGSVLTCRYRFTGPFSWLVGSAEYEWMRGNLQYYAALVCHRAEKLSGPRRAPVRSPLRDETTVADEGVAAWRTSVPDTGDGRVRRGREVLGGREATGVTVARTALGSKRRS